MNETDKITQEQIMYLLDRLTRSTDEIIRTLKQIENNTFQEKEKCIHNINNCNCDTNKKQLND